MKVKDVDKLIDFGKQLFAAVLRSRTGSLCDMARLLRFQNGTKKIHRQNEKLLILFDDLKQIYHKKVLEYLFK